MSRRNPFAARSDASLRAKARALSAERPPVVSTPEQRRTAFDGLGDGSTVKSASQASQRSSIPAIAVSVSAQLTRQGTPGHFHLTGLKATVRCEWSGDACDRAAAEEALVKAFVGAGYETDAPLGYGVRVTLSAEPPPSAPARRTPDRIETLCGLEEPLGDEPTEGELAAYGQTAPAPLAPIGSPDAPAWTRKPAAQHANARRLTPEALGPVKYEDMDPGETRRSFGGRMARRFGEV